MVSVLVSGASGPWPWTLRSVLGQETLLSQCLSPTRCINWYRQIKFVYLFIYRQI